MNNIKKFEETKKALAVFQEELNHFEEEVEKKLESEGIESKEFLKAFLTAVRTKELSIDKKNYFMRFESITFGNYMQPIRNNKRSINVIPLCFLLHLYTENLEVRNITDEEQTDIPFTLRGFWQMRRAERFVEDLISMQINLADMIQKQISDNSAKGDRVRKLEKILEIVETLDIAIGVNKDKKLYEIYYKEQVFKVKTYNRKLDIVPLCKMLTNYYVIIINFLEEYRKSLGKNENKQEISEMQLSFMKFMEQYFTLHFAR